MSSEPVAISSLVEDWKLAGNGMWTNDVSRHIEAPDGQHPLCREIFRVPTAALSSELTTHALVSGFIDYIRCVTCTGSPARDGEISQKS